MRKILCASVLLLALCVQAFAGEIMNPPAHVGIANPLKAPELSGDQLAASRVSDGTPDASAEGIKAAALTLLDTVLALL